MDVDGLLKGLRVVIDKGHGGADPGAVDPVNLVEGDKINTLEKDINTAIGNEFSTLLKLAGADVKNTRNSDVFLALGDRGKIAKGFGAHLFISFHADAGAPSAHGGSAHIFQAGGQDERLARLISKRMEEGGIGWRGTKVSNFQVIRDAHRYGIVGVLIETGFITNPDDEKNLNDPKYQKKIARIVFEAVCLWRAGKLPK